MYSTNRGSPQSVQHDSSDLEQSRAVVPRAWPPGRPLVPSREPLRSTRASLFCLKLGSSHISFLGRLGPLLLYHDLIGKETEQAPRY